jgi:hypothetical protein
VRIADWYLGLNLRGKVVVWLAAAVALFFAAYFGTLLVFSLWGEGEEQSAPAGAKARASPTRRPAGRFPLNPTSP